MASEPAQPKAAERGLPSYLWRFGQERRFSLLQRYAPLEQRSILDVGCGVGLYLRRFRELSPRVFGVDVELDRLRQAAGVGSHLALARAEALPFADHSFAMLLLHEVLEHVDDDGKALREAYRVLQPGGRMAVFVPNRWYPFETHGIYWRGRYRFGNYPLVGYLPDRWRQRLAPHVRAYTSRELRDLLAGLEGRIIVHTQIFPGYDRIADRWPLLGRVLRRISYFLEATPLRLFGLSHFLVFEKPRPERAPEIYHQDHDEDSQESPPICWRRFSEILQKVSDPLGIHPPEPFTSNQLSTLSTVVFPADPKANTDPSLALRSSTRPSEYIA